ncbi:hypothetical protein SAMN05216389_10699 [Oceanobacillus limi]|uniref:Uncharacterized protein n=1 Tax=Oceanobacillus limi TaxID=930131 RepID=A0A1I0C929_9BACI|nr:hypothetical protein [Oceanobacillus limi]SET15959.1 hypothetical protein SAMN05216389_10699 [Oceanobacillus limi]
MSDNKRVIRVKDLVIKADNVYFEPPRRRDPFFGGMVRDRREDTDESSSLKFESSSELVDDEREDKDERRPFSWI